MQKNEKKKNSDKNKNSNNENHGHDHDKGGTTKEAETDKSVLSSHFLNKTSKEIPKESGFSG